MWDQAVSYRDLKFDLAPFWREDGSGKATRRWLPVGMPRLSQNLEQCVFYLYGPHPKEDGNIIGPGATGFFVARHSDVLPYTYHVYAVSNRHAINPYPWVKVTSKDQQSRHLKLDQTIDWLESKTDDVAIADVTDELAFDAETGTWNDQLNWVNESDFVTRQRIFFDNIGIGDQTIMLGLFAGHSGPPLEIPTGRFGNIAARPSDENPIGLSSTDRFRRPVWLNDMRSRAGFSGSPVWAWRSPHDDMNFYRGPGFFPSIIGAKNPFLALLGIHRGQLPEEVKVLSDSGAMKKGDRLEIASAMTIIIPAWEITELVNDPTMQMRRDERDTRPDRKRFSDECQRAMNWQEGHVSPNTSGLS